MLSGGNMMTQIVLLWEKCVIANPVIRLNCCVWSSHMHDRTRPNLFSYVGAVLSCLETHVRISDWTPCTSKENTWIEPTALKDTRCQKISIWYHNISSLLKWRWSTSPKKKIKCACAHATMLWLPSMGTPTTASPNNQFLCQLCVILFSFLWFTGCCRLVRAGTNRRII